MKTETQKAIDLIKCNPNFVKEVKESFIWNDIKTIWKHRRENNGFLKRIKMNKVSWQNAYIEIFKTTNN